MKAETKKIGGMEDTSAFLSMRPDTPSDAMLHRIREKLEDVEREYGVRILYACESGSRAWGMASADSDCDVRFVYVRPVEHYLCVEPDHEPDVIECGVVETPDGVLDCNGWDVRKALRLLLRSNSSLQDWLASPIVYRCDGKFAPQVRELSERVVSKLRLWHHFRSLRDKSLHGFPLRPTAKLWLYAFRAQLGMLWLEQERGLPPSDMEGLCSALPEERPELRAELTSAIAAKRLGHEADSDFVPPAGLEALLREQRAKEAVSGNVRTFAWTIPALAESHSPDVKPDVRREVDEVFRSFLMW